MVNDCLQKFYTGNFLFEQGDRVKNSQRPRFFDGKFKNPITKVTTPPSLSVSPALLTPFSLGPQRTISLLFKTGLSLGLHLLYVLFNDNFSVLDGSGRGGSI